MAIELSVALEALQEAQKELAQAIASLGAHDQNEKAHPLILRQIDQILHSDKIFSRAQVRTLAQEEVNVHASKPIENAHAGFSDFAKDISERLVKVESDIVVLQDRINGTAQTSMSKLERKLQAVEDKYAPVLTSLQTTLNDAEQIGNRELADSIKSKISDTLSQKKDELLAVMEEWSQEQRNS